MSTSGSAARQRLRHDGLDDDVLSMHPGDVGRVLVSWVVQKDVERRLSYPVRSEFSGVERIPRGANGKLRSVIVEEV